MTTTQKLSLVINDPKMSEGRREILIEALEAIINQDRELDDLRAKVIAMEMAEKLEEA